jgi:hypothetical protein
MRACDIPLDYSSGGLYTCCEEHIMGCEQEVKVGDTIECEHCSATMILQPKDGKLMWRAV